MKQEDKDLLLIDLCGRLPYGVMVAEFDEDCRRTSIALPLVSLENDFSFYGNLKPYLFPLSSMTNEQEEELYILLGNESVGFQRYDNAFLDKDGYSEISMISILKGIDWLNANHFDYRGLIPMGLAADATGLNIY